MSGRRRIRIAGFVLVLGAAAGPVHSAGSGQAWAEQIELVTYYPAPGGAGTTFDRAHANRMTVGDAYNRTNVPDGNVPDGTLLVSTRVGIGTSNPQCTLQVTGGITAGPDIRDPRFVGYEGLYRAAGTSAGYAFSRWNIPTSPFPATWTAGDWWMWYAPDASGARLFAYGTGGGDFLTVTSQGNVGIGTPNPLGRLHVQQGALDAGSARFYTPALPSGPGYAANNFTQIRLGYGDGGFQSAAIRFNRDDASGNLLSLFHWGESTGLMIKRGGNIGIGTTNPQQRLHVYQPAANVWAAQVQSNQYGLYANASAYGLYGQATGASGYGVTGVSRAVGVYGNNSRYGSQGFLGYNDYGLYAESRYHAIYGYNTTYRTHGYLGYDYRAIYAIAPYYCAELRNQAGYTTYLNWHYWGLWTNGYIYGNWASSIDLKKNVARLSPREEAAILSRIEQLPLVHYLYKMDRDGRSPRLGVIAEWSPRELTSEDGKGLDPYTYATYSLAGVKALSAQVRQQQETLESQQEEIRNLKQQLQTLQGDKR